jgi:hypothetical protein
MSALKITPGDKFGHLTAIKECGRAHGHVMWEFSCACGTPSKLASVSDVKRGYVTSCGKKCGLKSANMPAPTKKECHKCRVIQSFDKEHFTPSHRSKHGLGGICRKCTNTRAKTVNLKERKRLRLEVLTCYSPNGVLGCSCPGCKESAVEFMTLDHIDGGGRQEFQKYPATMLYRRLRRLGYPAGYQMLCWNCNGSKGMYGYCPHQKSV